MMLTENLTHLFESNVADYTQLILAAAESIHGDKMVWSKAATALAQDRGLMARVGAVAGKLAKAQDERDDIVQDWFLNRFAGVLKSAAAAISAGDYTGKQFLTLVGVSVKQHFLNMKRGAGRRSSHERKKKEMNAKAVKRGVADTRTHGDEKAVLRRVVLDLVKKQGDAKARKFLTVFFGLAGGGKLSFAGMSNREALAKSGMEVDNKNQVWATRLVQKAMSDLRDNTILKKTMGEQVTQGLHFSRQLLAAMVEDSPLVNALFIEWLRDYAESLEE